MIFFMFMIAMVGVFENLFIFYFALILICYVFKVMYWTDVFVLFELLFLFMNR